jgi:hypothetical protein
MRCGFFSALFYALDVGDLSAARARRQAALDAAAAQGLLGADFAPEAAFFELAVHHDAERCRAWLERAAPALDRKRLRALQKRQPRSAAACSPKRC